MAGTNRGIGRYGLPTQREAIILISESLGDNIWKAMENDPAIPLNWHLKEARKKLHPPPHVNTLRSWFEHYCKYGTININRTKTTKAQ